jgi:hypothetical protein
MRTLSQADLLALWESGRTLHPIDQGLLAIHAAFPDTRHESVADWPLGRRNRALARLRCACFGASLRGWTSCRQCGEKLEFEFNGRSIADGCAPEHQEPIVVRGCAFRVPTSRDLAQIARFAAEHDAAEAALRLLEQCRADASPVPPSGSAAPGWTPEDVDAIGEQMALADPLAEIMLDFTCPACTESFQESLDFPVFLWSEMEAQAKRLLLDVHALASAYGWSESEILSLSAARRALYLQMVHA